MVNSFFAAEIFVNENSVLYKEDTDKGALTKWIKNKGKHDFFIKEFKTTIVVMKFILNEKKEKILDFVKHNFRCDPLNDEFKKYYTREI